MPSSSNKDMSKLTACIGYIRDQLTADQSKVPAVGDDHDATVWFVGPKGENASALLHLVEKSINANINARKNYMPDDPHFNTAPNVAEDSADVIENAIEPYLDKMLNLLQSSTPFASYRNQSHMNWDITLPGAVGYFAAMLYNPNNVATEASPVTTAMEMIVGDELCEMLGFNTDKEKDTLPIAWGHITCDGSIANGEAMWAARNLKYLPVALAGAIQIDKTMKPAADVSVVTSVGKRARLIDLTDWELLNLPIDDVIGLPARIVNTTELKEEDVRRAMDRYSVQNMGMSRFCAQFFNKTEYADPKIFVPSTAHYSWPKSAALLGLGTQSVVPVPVDLDGRMDAIALRSLLNECLQKGQPVLQVVAVIGSTEEGSADPLDKILAIREEFQQLGLEFVVHVDGAWGGYFASMIREPKKGALGEDRAKEIDYHPEYQLSDYVHRQLASFAKADSITIDPHKSGFIPYPAGSLCYRNGAMRDLIAYTAPVVYHGGVEATVGPYGIEGSKPGAAAASVYLSHAVIRLNQAGYGRLLGRCLFNNKRFHAAIVSMAEPNDQFVVTTFQRLPIEKQGGTAEQIQEEIDFIKKNIVPRSNKALFEYLKVDDPDSKKAQALFKELGSDLSILAYSFNLKMKDGINTDVILMNELNDAIYRELSVRLSDLEKGGVPTTEMVVTESAFERTVCGDEFMQCYADRNGVKYLPEIPIKFLISTTQNPWLSAAAPMAKSKKEAENCIDIVIEVLRKTANEKVAEIKKKHGVD